MIPRILRENTRRPAQHEKPPQSAPSRQALRPRHSARLPGAAWERKAFCAEHKGARGRGGGCAPDHTQQPRGLRHVEVAVLAGLPPQPSLLLRRALVLSGILRSVVEGGGARGAARGAALGLGLRCRRRVRCRRRRLLLLALGHRHFLLKQRRLTAASLEKTQFSAPIGRRSDRPGLRDAVSQLAGRAAGRCSALFGVVQRCLAPVRGSWRAQKSIA